MAPLRCNDATALMAREVLQTMVPNVSVEAGSTMKKVPQIPSRSR